MDIRAYSNLHRCIRKWIGPQACVMDQFSYAYIYVLILPGYIPERRTCSRVASRLLRTSLRAHSRCASASRVRERTRPHAGASTRTVYRRGAGRRANHACRGGSASEKDRKREREVEKLGPYTCVHFHQVSQPERRPRAVSGGETTAERPEGRLVR